MNWSTQYKLALTKVLDHARTGDTDSISNDKNLFESLGSISNTEMFIRELSPEFIALGSDKFYACIMSLIDLEARFGDNTQRYWYFINTFSQVFNLYLRTIKVHNPPLHIIEYILKVRKNERMPFGKVIELHVKTLSDYETFLKEEHEKQSRHASLMQVHKEDTARKATTKIWEAIRRHDIKAVEVLLEKGADIYTLSPDSNNIEQYAEFYGNFEILDMIKAKINKFTSE